MDDWMTSASTNLEVSHSFGGVKSIGWLLQHASVQPNPQSDLMWDRIADMQEKLSDQTLTSYHHSHFYVFNIPNNLSKN